MISAFIFDLDGTLINSLDDLAASCNFALEQLGYAVHPVEAYKYFIGDGILKLLERTLPKENSTTEEISKLNKIYSEHYSQHCADKTRPYDGIQELLEQLKHRDYKLAVVSNKPHFLTEKVISKLFGKGLFDIVTGKRDGYAPKPDAALTKEIISQLGMRPENCAFVGDSSMDMLTAVSAKAIPVGVTWGFRLKKELIESGAQYIVDRPSDILKYIDIL